MKNAHGKAHKGRSMKNKKKKEKEKGVDWTN